MNDTMMRPSDDDLGARLATALDRRTTGVGSAGIDLRDVRRGARRRRVVRVVGVAAACTAVAIGGVIVLAQRDSEPPAPSDRPPADVPTPSPIGAVAVLASSFGEPVSVYASRGGGPTGADLPQVDVWQSGAKRIVVRTFVDLPDDPTPTVPISTAPATAVAVESGDPQRTSSLEALADDQWVAFQTADRQQGDNIVLRGMSRAEAEAAVDAITVVDGVRQPASGFDLVEHVDPAPSSTPTGWFVTVGYGSGAGDTWTNTWEPAVGRATLELETGWQVGAMESIAGRDVLVTEFSGQPGSSWTWIDESGIGVSVSSFDHALDASVVSAVTLAEPAAVEAIADALSAQLADDPLLATAQVDGVDLTIRGGDTRIAMCIGVGDAEQCTPDPNASLGAPPIGAKMDTIVDGEWVVFGAYQLVGDDRPNMADVRITTPDGTVLPITVVEQDGFLWTVIRVPGDAHSITVDWQDGAGGILGQVQRPLVIGTLG